MIERLRNLLRVWTAYQDRRAVRRAIRRWERTAQREIRKGFLSGANAAMNMVEKYYDWEGGNENGKHADDEGAA